MKKKLRGRSSTKKATLKNFAHLISNIYRKTSVLESLLIKLQEETPTQVFPVNIVKFLRTPILKNICERLPLKLVNFSLPFAIIKNALKE